MLCCKACCLPDFIIQWIIFSIFFECVLPFSQLFFCSETGFFPFHSFYSNVSCLSSIPEQQPTKFRVEALVLIQESRTNSKEISAFPAKSFSLFLLLFVTLGMLLCWVLGPIVFFEDPHVLNWFISAGYAHIGLSALTGGSMVLYFSRKFLKTLKPFSNDSAGIRTLMSRVIFLAVCLLACSFWRKALSWIPIIDPNR